MEVRRRRKEEVGKVEKRGGGRGGEKRKGGEEPGKDRFFALHSHYHYLKPLTQNSLDFKNI